MKNTKDGIPTPHADGAQYALQLLEKEKEVFVSN